MYQGYASYEELQKVLDIFTIFKTNIEAYISYADFILSPIMRASSGKGFWREQDIGIFGILWQVRYFLPWPVHFLQWNHCTS